MAEDKKNIVVVPMNENEYPLRYIIIDKDTGEILDDAQGYGFKAKQKAYACYYWKNRSEEIKQKELDMLNFFYENKQINRALEDASFYTMEDRCKLTEEDIIDIFKDFKDLPFTAKDVSNKWHKLDWKAFKKHKKEKNK